jgi:hypothetical protein
VVSILDEANATILVYPQVQGTDTDGNPEWRPAEVPVSVEAMVWPVATADAAVLSRETGEVYRVRPKRGEDIPVGPWAIVEWDGREWDVHGEAVRHRRGRATQRTTFTIRSRTKRPGDGGDDGG